MDSFLNDRLSFFQSFSNQYGSGSLQADFLTIAILLLIVLVLLVAVLVSKRTSSLRHLDGFNRLKGVMGRLEKMERTLNDFKSEVLRSTQITTAELESLKKDMHLLKSNLLDDEALAKETAPLPEDVWEKDTPKAKTLSGVLEPEEQKKIEVDWEEPPQRERKPTFERVESLSKKLKKTRSGLFGKIRGVFSSKPTLDQEALEELTALLISSDLGVKTVDSLTQEITNDIEAGQDVDEAILTGMLKMKILQILEADAPGNSEIFPKRLSDGPFVILMVGVNGVGKTTTTAKLASKFKQEGLSVVMVAADTFRAAAVEQLCEWGERIGTPVFAGVKDAKPSTVVYDAMQNAIEDSIDVVIIDTAGRLHTKSNLMQELEGVKNSIAKHQPSAPHETVLVVDGSTGQNAVQQAKEFHEAIPLTGIITTKLDGTPKGGVVVAIKNDLGIPVRYIGVGESTEDLRPFVARDFVEALFDAEGLDEVDSAHGEKRRRRRNDTESPTGVST